MEIIDFSSQAFLIASSFTLLSLLLTVLSIRLLKSPNKTRSSSFRCRACSSGCSSDGTVVNSVDRGGEAAAEMVVAAREGTGMERQCGLSMMEQLVPEITTHALSYLDYPSLCRLSMTNSLMRKAANDDNAWKALYHKDFTLEQDTVTPVNGWKAYYAATRAIVNLNAEFFSIIRESSLQDMSRLWLNADYVKCVHASGELFSGYNAVIQSWELAFNWEQGVDFQVRDVGVRVLTDIAWVSMKTYVDVDTGPFHVTNVFEFHNGRWYMVHHHSSVNQQIMHP
ncbi:F-box protein SKIP8 [Linum grandiflorum]